MSTRKTHFRAYDLTLNRTAYTANRLNQYTAEGSFTPTFDADGNQTRIKTSTGTWSVTYNAKNRPVLFTKSDGSVTVECTYDTMGRRAIKKVTTNGTLTEHRRFLYRGYLQIDSPPPHRRLTPAGQSRFAHCPTGLTAVGRLACCDLTRAYTPALWYILWDPTQPTATRPLAIQKNGTWYTYGWDLTKNICETYRTDGRIDLAYTYTPYGEVTPAHTYDQPLRWSSEYHDTELGLVYYNYRHYNPAMGRWMARDRIIPRNMYNLYSYGNTPIKENDVNGLFTIRYEIHGVGHTALTVQGRTWDFGRYIGHYSFESTCEMEVVKKMEETAAKSMDSFWVQEGPMILMKDSAKANEKRYEYPTSKELNAIMSNILNEIFSNGSKISSVPKHVIERLENKEKYNKLLNSSNARYLNEDWTLSNNCTTRMMEVIRKTADKASQSNREKIRKDGKKLQNFLNNLGNPTSPWEFAARLGFIKIENDLSARIDSVMNNNIYF